MNEVLLEEKERHSSGWRGVLYTSCRMLQVSRLRTRWGVRSAGARYMGDNLATVFQGGCETAHSHWGASSRIPAALHEGDHPECIRSRLFQVVDVAIATRPFRRQKLSFLVCSTEDEIVWEGVWLR